MLGKESRESNNETQPTNKWVKNLQQESWELELLISGFSIILLTKSTEWLQVVINNISANLNTSINLISGLLPFLSFVLLASYALIINLIIHLIFRGFWVGIVGLGSVAPNTNFLKLKYSAFFTKKLEKKITKLDDLVVIVDKISSLIFTFAFLIIFFLVSVGLYLLCLSFLAHISHTLSELSSGAFESIIKVVFSIIIPLYLISGLIYMFDFLTLGLLKKNKRISKIYYPIYHLFGWITLSFIYRTLYYNLISKFSKRKIGLILIPYLLIIIMIPFFNYNHHIYYPEDSNTYHINNDYYANLRSDDAHISKVDIPFYLIKDNFLPLFLYYNPNFNRLIKKLNPDFTSSINEGFNSDIQLRVDGKRIIKDDLKGKEQKSLECLASIFKIYLNDSLIESPKFYFKTSTAKNDKGIFTILNIENLPRGENILNIKQVSFANDSLFEDYAFVPFWKD